MLQIDVDSGIGLHREQDDRALKRGIRSRMVFIT
jgi:hypothetical protein